MAFIDALLRIVVARVAGVTLRVVVARVLGVALRVVVAAERAAHVQLRVVVTTPQRQVYAKLVQSLIRSQSAHVRLRVVVVAAP